MTNFEDLEEALRNAAFELCAPSVSVRKLYDPTSDSDTLEDAVPGVGWTLTGTVTAPAPGTFDWVLAVGATGPTAEPSPMPPGSPRSNGHSTNPNGDSTIVVSEDSAANPPDPPGGEFINLPEETECTFRTRTPTTLRSTSRWMTPVGSPPSSRRVDRHLPAGQL